jgi:hypothetical protein
VKQQNDATAWRKCRRPSCPRRNPCNKRWFIELMAREHRDRHMEELRQDAVSGFLSDTHHAALRQLVRLKADDEIDALCMPEWAARSFAWSWEKYATVVTTTETR